MRHRSYRGQSFPHLPCRNELTLRGCGGASGHWRVGDARSHPHPRPPTHIPHHPLTPTPRAGAVRGVRPQRGGPPADQAGSDHQSGGGGACWAGGCRGDSGALPSLAHPTPIHLSLFTHCCAILERRELVVPATRDPMPSSHFRSRQSLVRRAATLSGAVLCCALLLCSAGGGDAAVQQLEDVGVVARATGGEARSREGTPAAPRLRLRQGLSGSRAAHAHSRASAQVQNFRTGR